MLDAALGSTGSPWIPERRPGAFHSSTPSVCLRAAEEMATLEATFLPSRAFQSCHPPRLPARPLLQGPFPASHSSNCLLQPCPKSSQNQEGAPWPRLCRGDLGSTPREGLYPRELRSSGANAPVSHQEQILVCLGHSGGLGTSFSRNAALTGHNSCCCAASLPGMGFLGHTLESHGALLLLPSLAAPLCALQLHFPSPKCIKKLNFPLTLPNPARFFWR